MTCAPQLPILSFEVLSPANFTKGPIVYSKGNWASKTFQGWGIQVFLEKALCLFLWKLIALVISRVVGPDPLSPSLDPPINTMLCG